MSQSTGILTHMTMFLWIEPNAMSINIVFPEWRGKLGNMIHLWKFPVTGHCVHGGGWAESKHLNEESLGIELSVTTDSWHTLSALWGLPTESSPWSCWGNAPYLFFLGISMIDQRWSRITSANSSCRSVRLHYVALYQVILN